MASGHNTSAGRNDIIIESGMGGQCTVSDCKVSYNDELSAKYTGSRDRALTLERVNQRQWRCTATTNSITNSLPR